MSNNFFEALDNGTRELGIQLSDKQKIQFETYKDLLKEWNNKINLTSILDDEDIAIKHFVDSLTILNYIKDDNVSLIDIGTGAGFPGIPVKILRDNVNVTLLDSLEKRIKFLNEVTTTLNLSNIQAIHKRAEDLGVDLEYRQKFDYACARAVAGLPVLLEYCLPFVKVGGIFIAMKGSNIDEVSLSQNALKILGGKIEEIREFNLPNSDYKRNIIVVKKIKQTPKGYPRKAGKPSKMPL